MDQELRSRKNAIRDRSDLTIPALFAEREKMSPDVTAYLVHDGGGWQKTTWRAMGVRVNRLRAALRALNLAPGDRVGLWLENGIDWVACDVAAMSESLVTVPLYTRDSGANISYVIQNAGVCLCIVDTFERWRDLVAQGHDIGGVMTVWTVGSEPIQIDCLVTSDNRVTTLPSLDINESPAQGASNAVDRTALASIVYTSGTTGAPKGVMLSHRSILLNASAVNQVNAVRPDDVFLSLLPLAHGFERTLGCYLPMMSCATVAFNRSVALLREDMAQVKPTHLLAVPRLFERIVAAVRSEARESALGALLLPRIESIGWKRAEAELYRAQAPSWLARIFWAIIGKRTSQRVRGIFGGRLRIALSGGAPLSRETFKFMLGMGVPLIEGYGLTEAGPAVTGSTLEDRHPGSVGRPLPGVEVRLGMDDELLVRTPSAMLGYWGNPEATSKTLDADGWLHTGDVAELRGGRIYIRGRLKDILVLSTGENVNPTATESALLADPLVDQVCVLGDGKPWCCAVVVANRVEWQAFVVRHGLHANDPNASAARQALVDHLSTRMSAVPPFAQVRDVHVELEPWSLDSGLITPTLKAKRPRVAAKYEQALSRLYDLEPLS